MENFSQQFRKENASFYILVHLFSTSYMPDIAVGNENLKEGICERNEERLLGRGQPPIIISDTGGVESSCIQRRITRMCVRKVPSFGAQGMSVGLNWKKKSDSICLPFINSTRFYGAPYSGQSAMLAGKGILSFLGGCLSKVHQAGWNG